MRLLFIVTRNEGELLRWNLAHHLSWGFDHALVADNESTDATRDVLREFGAAVTHTTVASPNERYVALAALLDRAEARHGEAQWIAVSDTDEFWWAPVAGIGSVLGSLPAEALALNAGQKLFLPTAADAPAGPIMCRRRYRSSRDDSPLHTSYVRGKSIYRAGWLRGRILDDNHRSSSIAPASWRRSGVPLVHHYMIEGEDAFVRKVLDYERHYPPLVAVARARRPLTDQEAAAIGFRGFKRSWWDIYATGGEEALRRHYSEVYVLDEAAIRANLASGDLVLDRAFADYSAARLAAGA